MENTINEEKTSSSAGSVLVRSYSTLRDLLSSWNLTVNNQYVPSSASINLHYVNQGRQSCSSSSSYYSCCRGSAHVKGYELWRVLYCQEDENTCREVAMTGSTSSPSTLHDKTEWIGLARGAWRELNRNVPQRYRNSGFTGNNPNENHSCSNSFNDIKYDQSSNGVLEECQMINSSTQSLPKYVSVGRIKSPSWSAPIVVLVGLKYGGNIGTIIRSVVQSNAFQAIYFVEERGFRKEQWANNFYCKTWGEPKENDNDKKTESKSKCSNKKQTTMPSDKEISYYSMWNAPLIEMKKFATVDEFLIHVDEENLTRIHNCCARSMNCDNQEKPKPRGIVCLDLGPRSTNLYSKEALELFQSDVGKNMYLVIGAEDTGCPTKIVERANALIEIPAMSASINVSCAFMACLSVYMLSQNVHL
mmetsp:Transcript_17647/g.24899  ORF Transcript_17647/g.24899 Transcript_17647/m.24899 type:complete len:417 (+) Transcript_17647:180-1430(+)